MNEKRWIEGSGEMYVTTRLTEQNAPNRGPQNLSG